ncbi:GNAT family N-acetyltransferase [Gimesia algae]|uniref:Acetyltransferase (GNAT) family protein n=1 Tax=Gimesia algae TaxID=2527971 RepID=A0A517V8E5_9PLAN|nr:GNAT family N-acetyltransferase [Gimesia algae]QDT89268.1 Acetyltransferase (GNAT) family protein [Gimesia algae]
MKPITIRQAVLSDLDALAPLFDSYRQFYGRASDITAAREFLLNRFQQEESVLFLASQEEKRLGFTQLYPSFSSVSLARTFLLNDLFVIPEGRRKGIATRLLSVAADYARGVNAIRLSLSTEVTNATAQALYESAGWKQDTQFLVYHFQL